MNDGKYLAVLVSVSDAKIGVAIGRALVEERLAGCVQVMPGGTAIYRWQGVLYADTQAQLIIKTTQAAWPALQARILELHSDEAPEILALPVTDGLPAYLRWMDEVVTT
jgi:periplasmic divalent cation tolerance protein